MSRYEISEGRGRRRVKSRELYMYRYQAVNAALPPPPLHSSKYELTKTTPEAKFLDVIGTKVLRVFLLAIHKSPLLTDSSMSLIHYFLFNL